MPNLTEGAIRKAFANAEKSRKQISLTDGEGRGTGRLALILKPMPTRVTAEWMAQQWRDGKRTKSKIGAYPTMSLAEAREIFKRDFAEVIQKRSSIKVAGDTRTGTVADLFDGYVRNLKETGKSSWPEAESSLNKAAEILGRNRAARDVSPDDVLGVLRPIYERGKPAMADHVRSYVRSAYSWGIKSEHDYRNTSPRRFKLVSNPAASIPTEPKVVGTRWLNEAEFVRLYRWLEFPDVPVHPPYARAVRILMLTGQRVEEIAKLHIGQWDAKEKIIDWSKTKNGKPHAIPVPPIAAALIGSIIPNRHGWFFPSATDPSKPVSAGTLYSFMWRQRERGVIPVVTNRDLRRTWKTLAGKAGVSKELRDRLQNHTLQDVSSKSYDRWNYMPEKREKKKKVWVLLDRLDVAFVENHSLEANALRALIRAYADIRHRDEISLKIFLREDIWKRITEQGLREASHLIRYVILNWTQPALLNLIMRRLLKNAVLVEEFKIDAVAVLQDAEQQEALFYRLFPKQVEQGPQKAPTFKWLVTRCADGTGKTTPREVIHLLNCILEQEIKRLEQGGAPAPNDQLFDRSVFKLALPTVSDARLNQYLYAEYPSERPFVSKLDGQKAEQTADSLSGLWGMNRGSAISRAKKLVELGFFEEREKKDQTTYWVPFLYRDALHLVQDRADGDDDDDPEACPSSNALRQMAVCELQE